MELKHLRTFITLAETLHFGRAAERLNMTQPPLSRQIAALEDSLDVRLFDRYTRHVSLTTAGEQLLIHARRILDDVDMAINSVRGSAQKESRQLHIGFTMYAAWNLLPNMVKRYGETYPQDKIALDETLPSDLNSKLAKCDIDVGVSFGTPGEKNLKYLPMLQEHLCAVLPEGHRLAAKKRISVAALATEAFITFPAVTAPVLHKAVMACCLQAQFTPEIRLETHLQQTIVNLVAAGLGVALVPESMQRLQIPGAVFRPLRQSQIIEQGIFWSSKNSNPALVDFIAMLRQK